MPYKIEKKTGEKPWKIVKEDTGEVVGSANTRGEAIASMRARYAAEGGMRLKKKNV